MRGPATRQSVMLLGVTTDDLIPGDQPIREIKKLVAPALAALSPSFATRYDATGRRSVPPEHLLNASLRMALYSIRSERQLGERLQYDLLFKGVLDLNIADPAFDHSTFSTNRDRLLKHAVADAFFAEGLDAAKRRRLRSADHFTVDGTLWEAWASPKRFKPKPPADGEPAADGGSPPDLPPPRGRNPEVDVHGERRSNARPQSTTDPEARLAKKGKGKEAKLSFLGQVLMENRNGLVVDLRLPAAPGTAEREAAAPGTAEREAAAPGTAEREAALDRLRHRPGKRRKTLGADKNYDTKEFVTGCRARNVTPQVTRKQHSAIDERTTTFPGYQVSQKVRKRVEEIFGGMKPVGGGRKRR